MTDPVVQGQVSARAPDGALLTGKGVGIAVVDTGIDGTHPDLVYGNIVKRNLKIFYGQTVEMSDTDTTSGHGTAVAGIASGRGYVPAHEGMAPGATLYGLGAGEVFSVFWALQAYDWILSNHDRVDPPIKVVVNSWGSAGSTHSTATLGSWYVSKMVDEGITVVYAAGNGGGDGSSDRTTPECNHPREGVVCVGAYRDGGRTQRDGSTASFSARGRSDAPATWPDLVAPGDMVTTTLALTGATAATGVWQESPSLLYTTMSGTSMSTPMVAAAAAILYQLDPKITPAGVERALEQGAYPYDGEGRGLQSGDVRYAGSTFDRGHGLLDTQNAVDTWLRLRTTTPTSGSTGSTTDPSTDPGSDGSTTDTTGGLVDDTIDTIDDTIGSLV